MEGWGEFGFICWEVQGVRVRVILILLEFILNALVIHLVIPMFDVTDSLGFPPR